MGKKQMKQKPRKYPKLTATQIAESDPTPTPTTKGAKKERTK